MRRAISCLLLLLLPLPAVARDLDHRTVAVGGVSRSYELYVPPDVARAGAPAPLVIVLHGGGGTGAGADRMTGFSNLAAREGFVVAYPNGSSRQGDRLLTWNAGKCCGYAMRTGVDDVGFIAALIDTLVATGEADPARVYLTGMSNGAIMTHYAARALPGRIAAAAPVAGGLFGSEPAPRGPVPMLTVNGSEDAAVPPAGGVPGGRVTQAFAPGATFIPASAAGKYWAAAGHCRATPRVEDRGPLTVTTYACPAEGSVVQVLVNGTGHAWPGGRKGTPRGDDPGTSFDATAAIWHFFEAHRN